MKQAMPMATTSPIRTNWSGSRSMPMKWKKANVAEATINGPMITRGRKPILEARRPVNGARIATVIGGRAVSRPACNTE